MRYPALILCVLPGFAFAAGGSSTSAPATSQTTTQCQTGFVYDDKTKTCVAPKDSRLNDDQRYQAVREFAYMGKFDAAQTVLAAISDQTDGRVLTYWGFTHGKQGNLDVALGFYDKAITADPNNILARSYKGQALAEAGDKLAAYGELREIVSRGGEGTWAEASLRSAIMTGAGYNY
ncbi:MAG: hypothetical protein MK098_02585 [Marinovum sp.]|nr:hypothetical protein [Marinovum sp.]